MHVLTAVMHPVPLPLLLLLPLPRLARHILSCVVLFPHVRVREHLMRLIRLQILSI